jgi:ribonuclease HII
VNILAASLAAMARAVLRLRLTPGVLLIDGNKIIPLALLAKLDPRPAQKAIVDGDALIPVISAASILAKTFRDKLLCALAKRYPGYGLARHKGYGTAEHLRKIEALGPCPLHRATFRGVAQTGPSPEQPCLPGI